MKEKDVKAIVEAVVEQTGLGDITLAQAKILIQRVEEKAREMRVNAVIAVRNAGGNPVAVHCMDDSYIASYDIALQKAYTSVALKMSTIELKKLSQPGGSLYGIQNTNEGRIVIFGGGEPLQKGGKVIGGLGVSGGSEEEDSALAAYGVQIAKEVFQWQ